MMSQINSVAVEYLRWSVILRMHTYGYVWHWLQRQSKANALTWRAKLRQHGFILREYCHVFRH